MADDNQGMTPVADKDEVQKDAETQTSETSVSSSNYEGPLPKVIIGQKVQMTQIFAEDGVVHAVTIVKADPIAVIGLKTIDKDGYQAVQFGVQPKLTGKRKDSKIDSQRFGKLQEFLTDLELPVGTEVSVDTFSDGDAIHAQGISKGKGFQGGVKRHGMAGGPRTHGQKHSEREIGSIGGGGREGGRVVRGKKMPGRMGTDTVTVKNLTIVKVDKDNAILYVKGALPGRRGSFVTLYGAPDKATAKPQQK